MEADPAMKRVGVAMVAAVLAWGIGTLSDGYMVVPTSQVMSTAVLMLAVMWLRMCSPSVAPSPKRRFIPIVWTIFCAIALTVLALLPATEFGQPTRREQVWRAEHPGALDVAALLATGMDRAGQRSNGTQRKATLSYAAFACG